MEVSMKTMSEMLSSAGLNRTSGYVEMVIKKIYLSKLLYELLVAPGDCDISKNSFEAMRADETKMRFATHLRMAFSYPNLPLLYPSLKTSPKDIKSQTCPVCRRRLCQVSRVSDYVYKNVSKIDCVNEIRVATFLDDNPPEFDHLGVAMESHVSNRLVCSTCIHYAVRVGQYEKQ